MTADLETRYPYLRADLEKVSPSQIREGDLIAFRGPVGSDRFSGNPVLNAGLDGRDYLGCEKYSITYRQANSGRELEIGQPESMPVWRVRKDRRKDGAW